KSAGVNSESQGSNSANRSPSESTSTRDVVQALLQGSSIERAGHVLTYDGSLLKARSASEAAEPRIDRKAHSRGYSTPWWAAALVAVMVHNHSTLYDTHLSPHELASSPADAEGAVNTWLKLHKWVGSAHALLTQLHVFHAGDKVRLYRVIDGRRRVEGPFELTTVDGGPTICHMAEFKRREGEKFLVGCLDRTASGKWVLPRSDDTEETVSAGDILGEQSGWSHMATVMFATKGGCVASLRY
ncbi:hypothetical protein FOZ63_000735, partial [Perkinsus olseni]